MKNRYVLKNKRRFCMFVAVLVVLSITFLYSGISYGYKETPKQKIIVQKGDTLWDIAKKYNKGEDIRKTVYQIKKANNLYNSDIFEGQVLIVPAR